MSEKIYDVLKYVQRIVLPACAALYSALGKLWGWEYIPEIVGTITAVDTFMGALLQIEYTRWQNEQNPGE